MSYRTAIYFIGLLLTIVLKAQVQSDNIRQIQIENNDNFNGFELLETADYQLFVLAEHWHNIRRVPEATLKVLRYLHQEANVRIFAIEQGASAAYMINKYLESGDTVVLRQIIRNTMFWGRENYQFFQNLRTFNLTLRADDQIKVRSIDIEYKMESAIFVINEFVKGKKLPSELENTVGQFINLFENTRAHREQYDGLSVMFYYNKDRVKQLVDYTLYDLDQQPSSYSEYFGEDFERFKTMIQDMFDGLVFDYTNPNTKYKFRDRIIYDKFIQLAQSEPNVGILCVIGLRHATKGSSISKLDILTDSPLNDRVLNVRISALYNQSFKSSDLRRINFAYPKQLKINSASLTKHEETDPALKSKKKFDYTIFINDEGNLTPFKNVYKGSN